jgi:hypothetical protein
MRKRFIGPANPGADPETGQWVDDLGHEVNVAGRYLGRVKAGDVLDIPDDLATGTKENPPPVWSAALWEDVADKAAAKTVKKGDD